MITGNYSFQTGLSACLKSSCPAGHYQRKTGCTRCPRDTFQPHAGQPNCWPCESGHFAAPGATHCGATPEAPARCKHTTCQYNGHHLRVQHMRLEANQSRHHCFYRTFTGPEAWHRCCYHQNIDAEACFHRHFDGHCDHTGERDADNAPTPPGECICLCFRPELLE
eukprot:g4458.t1